MLFPWTPSGRWVNYACFCSSPAAELSVSDNEGTAELGVAELKALGDSDLFDDSQKLFIDAALESVIQQLTQEIEEIDESGDAAQVIEDPAAE